MRVILMVYTGVILVVVWMAILGITMGVILGLIAWLYRWFPSGCTIRGLPDGYLGYTHSGYIAGCGSIQRWQS